MNNLKLGIVIMQFFLLILEYCTYKMGYTELGICINILIILLLGLCIAI